MISTKKLLVILVANTLVIGCAIGNVQESHDSFANPPCVARPTAFWDWLNGNVDLHQLTKDIEEAKANGMDGLDFFDASINRIAAWVIGNRNMIKSLLFAMLEPTKELRASHRFDGADKANPYFVFSDPSHTDRPRCKMNAGYLDGSVRRYDSMDAMEVKNYQAFNYLARPR